MRFSYNFNQNLMIILRRPYTLRRPAESWAQLTSIRHRPRLQIGLFVPLLYSRSRKMAFHINGMAAYGSTPHTGDIKRRLWRTPLMNISPEGLGRKSCASIPTPRKPNGSANYGQRQGPCAKPTIGPSLRVAQATKPHRKVPQQREPSLFTLARMLTHSSWNLATSAMYIRIGSSPSHLRRNSGRRFPRGRTGIYPAGRRNEMPPMQHTAPAHQRVRGLVGYTPTAGSG